MNKTDFVHNKHQFRDLNEKNEVNSMFKKRWYGMPAVRLNMEITLVQIRNGNKFLFHFPASFEVSIFNIAPQKLNQILKIMGAS